MCSLCEGMLWFSLLKQLQVLFLQLLQFSFWRDNSPKIWEILQQNSKAFFEDDGEVALSRLSSIISSSPYKFDVNSTGQAFRFQKIAKSVEAIFQDPEESLQVHTLLLFWTRKRSKTVHRSREVGHLCFKPYPRYFFRLSKNLLGSASWFDPKATFLSS